MLNAGTKRFRLAEYITKKKKESTNLCEPTKKGIKLSQISNERRK